MAGENDIDTEGETKRKKREREKGRKGEKDRKTVIRDIERERKG